MIVIPAEQVSEYKKLLVKYYEKNGGAKSADKVFEEIFNRFSINGK